MGAPASRRLIVAFTFVAMPLAGALGLAQAIGRTSAPPAPSGRSASGLNLQAMNRAADPCTDFYQFACGGWIASNPIPADQARWGTFETLQERNNEVLRGVLEAAAAGADPATRKIGEYYASCMDEAAIEGQGAAPLEEDFERIAALASVEALPAFLAGLHRAGVNAFFRFGAEADFRNAGIVIAQLDQGGLGLPDRDYYFRADARSADIRGQYINHVGTLASLAGGAAQTPPAAVMRIETALAKAALDNVSRRDPAKIYHRMTPAELQAMTPNFAWAAYFRAAGAPSFDVLNVAEPEFFGAFSDVLRTATLDEVKAYLRWHVVHAHAFLLSTPFVDEHFRFYSTTLRGISEQRARWKRCVQYTDADLGEALGRAFVAAAFSPQAKADMLDMVRRIEAAPERDIAALPWMTEATRTQAVAKLRAVSHKIGYPDVWRDYSSLEIIRGDAVGNSRRANAFEFGRQMRKIGRAVDKTEWAMTPPTVNAYYHPTENNINFPAGILQTPFYEAGADPAVNYGGAGAVIGHELTHGFDDQGRRFDAAGNLRDWWTAADAKAFEDRAACFVDQYAGFTAIDDVKVNGRLTLGENVADNGGLRLALMAYLASIAGLEPGTIDGFTPEQRLFLGWGQVWCESRRPEYERLQAQTNPHAPGRYRVNGVVSNMPEFQKAFSCRPQAPMVRANACRVW